MLKLERRLWCTCLYPHIALIALMVDIQTIHEFELTSSDSKLLFDLIRLNLKISVSVFPSTCFQRLVSLFLFPKTSYNKIEIMKNSLVNVNSIQATSKSKFCYCKIYDSRNSFVSKVLYQMASLPTWVNKMKPTPKMFCAFYAS